MALKDKLMTLEDFKAVRDVDVASNSAQFTEIKADLDAQVDDINESLGEYAAASDSIKSVSTFTLTSVAWEQGYWGYGEGAPSSSNNYIRTQNIDANYEKGGFYIDVPEGYELRALFYNGAEDDYSYSHVYTDWSTGPVRLEIAVPKAVIMRLILRKTPSDIFPPEEAPTIKINRYVYGATTSDSLVNIERVLPLDGNPIVQGSYNGAGDIVYRETSLRTKYFVKICKGEQVVFTAGTKAAEIALGVFHTDKTYKKEIGYQNGGVVYDADEDGYIIPIYRTSEERPVIAVSDYDAITKIIPAWVTSSDDTTTLLYSMLSPRGETFGADKWEQGYYGYSNGEPKSSSSYIRTGNIGTNYGKGGFYIDIPDGYTLRALFYNGDVYANIYTDSINGPYRLEFRAPKAEHVRFTLKYTAGDAITPSDVPTIIVNRYMPSNGTPELTAAQKSQILALIDEYYNHRSNIVYYFNNTVNALPSKSSMYDPETNKLRLNCGLFAQMIWSGVSYDTFANQSTYNANVVKAFDWGYFHPFFAHQNVEGLAQRDSSQNVTKLYGLTNAPTPKYPTVNDTYSYTSIYDDSEATSNHIFVMDNGELVDSHQKWKSFMTVANQACELQLLGYEVPLSEADVGDLLFYEQLPYDMTPRYNNRFRRIDHVAIVTGRDANGFLEIAEVTYYHNNTHPVLKYGMLTNDDFLQAKYAHGIERIVMCARHPAAWGVASNVPDKFVSIPDRRNG